MRLIDADEVKRFYKTKFKDLDNGVHWSMNDILMNLDCIETVDIAPVIRCNECKYWWQENNLCTHNKTMDGMVCALQCDAYFYCGYAERKDK